MKEKYHNLKVGDFIELLQDEYHEGQRFPKGTVARILSFPVKIHLRDTSDGYWRQGNYSIYNRFIHAITSEGKHVRPHMSRVTKSKTQLTIAK